MDVLQLARELRAAADLIVTDLDGHSLLIVEVKARLSSREHAAQTLAERIARFGFLYGMLVDPGVIQIYQRDHTDPIASLTTSEAFRPYDPNFEANTKWTFHDYLQGMTESWLADFTSAWRHLEPPHYAVMAEIGLATRLAGCRIDVGGTLS